MSVGGGKHWMALEGGADGSPGEGSYTSRFAAIGACLPQRRLSTDEVMASTKYRTDIELEQLTGCPRAPYRRRGPGFLHAGARCGPRRVGARGLCRGGSGHAARVQYQPPRRWPAGAARAAAERGAEGCAGRRARARPGHLQRVRGDDDRRVHSQRPDSAGPDPARDGRQWRVHLGAGAQCRAGGPHGDGRPARLADARGRRRRRDSGAGAAGRCGDRGGRVYHVVGAQSLVCGVPGHDWSGGDDAYQCPRDPSGRDRGGGPDASGGARCRLASSSTRSII